MEGQLASRNNRGRQEGVQTMISIMILNKVLQTKDIGLIQNNMLTKEYFIGYEDEFDFIIEHQQRYGNVPDKASFLDKFKNFEPLEVTEADKYLVDTVREEYLYWKTVPVIQQAAELLKSDSNSAAEYLISQMHDLQPSYSLGGVDIVKRAEQRLKILDDKISSKDPWYITTGFEELDDIIHGWAKGEELVVFFARTGQGKSWVLAKTLSHAWQTGSRVGYISPEMSPVKVGYRFDTLTKNFSNNALVWANKDKLDYEGYKKYVDELGKKDGFIVATPMDFQKRITVSKLKAFIKSNKLDILGVDGITYMSDERSKKGDNKTISLTNISEDLISLSVELGVPIIVVVQSNRGGAKSQEDEGTPDLEYIRDSDGIAQNATKVISLRQIGGGIEFGIKKHRDGITGGKLNYYWDIDVGEFKYLPADGDAVKPQTRTKKVEEAKKSFKDGKDVF